MPTHSASVEVPELGPLLGRLTRLGDNRSAVPGLADLRLEMLSELFETAGRAREVSAEKGGEVEDPRTVLGSRVWLDLFRTVARKAAAATIAEVDRRLEEARRSSTMPSRRFRKLTPKRDDQEIILNRALAAAIPMERATPPETLPPPQWNDGVRHLAGALEESWERLDQVLTEELVMWSMVAHRIAAWRRPPGVLWWALAFLALVALALGLSIGGYLPAPGPLAGIRSWWWSLPWP